MAILERVMVLPQHICEKAKVDAMSTVNVPHGKKLAGMDHPSRSLIVLLHDKLGFSS